MKKYLLPENVNWYRANMHCHSNISDGSLSPEELKEAYKNRGYSILAITDHEILVDHSDLNDRDFLTLTASEYSINDGAPMFPVKDGAESPGWTRRKTIHMCVFSKDPHNTFQPAADAESIGWVKSPYKENAKTDGHHRVYSKEGINEAIRILNENGFLVQYNHPNWSLNDREDYLALEGVWSLEILNYATEILTGAEYCPYIYDEMLRNGMDIYCSMGDDNHNRGGSLEQSFGGSTMIGADELTYDKVFAAMEKGEFYCTSGRDNPPLIHALYVEDNVIKVDCSPAVAVFVNGYCRAFRRQVGENITHAEFPLDKNDVYFRITVRDKFGNNAHTHAYRVADYFEEK